MNTTIIPASVEAKLARGIPQWRCKTCGSFDVQGTLPAWFSVNRPLASPDSIDEEADYGYGHCGACEASGEFHEVAERATQR